MKRHAPAAARNRDPIADVLAEELPASGTVLEVASGTGEHALHFARRFPDHRWQPSDPDPGARESISAWCSEEGPDNLAAPIALDAAQPDWPIAKAAAILCINMVHISPVAATLGLLNGAAHVLAPEAPLILYGPYFERDVPTTPSNIAFDASLGSRDPQWGLRELSWLDAEAAERGFLRKRRVEMPANNLMLVYRRV